MPRNLLEEGTYAKKEVRVAGKESGVGGEQKRSRKVVRGGPHLLYNLSVLGELSNNPHISTNCGNQATHNL